MTPRNAHLLRQAKTMGPLLSLTLAAFGIGCSRDAEPVAQQSQTLDAGIFISELHYDNAGTDTGEAVELQGPAGSDLSGFSLVLYNGNGGAPYRTIALSGVFPDQGNGFGTQVIDTEGLQNGSPDGLALVDAEGVVLQFLSYEGTFVAVGGPADGSTSVDIGVEETSSTKEGQSLQFVEGAWTGPADASFGTLNEESTDEEPVWGSCGDTITAISAIQGTGASTPLNGETVETEGVVVGDFQGSGEHLGGFFLQAESPDGDPQTSEGIFVYDAGASSSLDVSVGQRVRVGGVAGEYFELTQISAAQVLDCGSGVLPSPTSLPLPYEDLADLEALEGMLVDVFDLTVTEVYNLGRYGEVSLSAGGRLFNPTNTSDTTAAENAQRRILLDDGRDAQNLDPVYLGETGTLRVGDSLPELTAVLHYAFDTYRLQPIDRENVAFVSTNPRTSSPSPVGGDVTVASLNVLNYFTTLGERGADTIEELERQRQKLVSAIIALDADVLGLMEIENNEPGAEGALDDLVDSVNLALGADVYARAPDPNFTGTDAIRTALIYQKDSVTALPISLSDDDEVHHRPPIAQTFSYQGDVFSVIVNHFKSKGSCPSEPDDPDADLGQGCWNSLRTRQAEALVDFVSEVQAQANDQDVVILGDLNSYLNEDPIVALENAGWDNWVATLPSEDRYSYVFFGESGVLDYAMTTPSLNVTGVSIWHINADEPTVLDYNTEFNPPELYQPGVYRSSDHDPVLLGLDLHPTASHLLNELSDATDEVVRESDLRQGQIKQLGALLAVAGRALTRAESLDDRPLARGLALRLTRTTLELYTARVEAFRARELLSASRADILTTGAARVLAAL